MIPETLCPLRANAAHQRTTFYKFVSRSTAAIVLRNRTLRWSTPAHLNDPHDNQFDFSSEIDRDLARKETLRKLWENHYEGGQLDASNQLGALIARLRGQFPRLGREEFDDEFGQALRDVFERQTPSISRFNDDIRAFAASNKVLCLTEKLDCTLMWAHYAEAHSGVALRFRIVPELDSVWAVAEPIGYRDAPPALYNIDAFSDLMSGRAVLDRKAILQRIALTKASAWAYEKEWRIFAGSGRDKQAAYEDISFNRLELDAVVLGCKMSASDRGDPLAISARPALSGAPRSTWLWNRF